MNQVDTFKVFIETQLLSSPFLLLVVMLNLAGIALWKWRKFDNDFISPLKVLSGGIVYPFIADPSKIYFTTNNPQFANFIIGCCIGGIAVVFHPVIIRVVAKVEQLGKKYLNGDLDHVVEKGATPHIDKKRKNKKMTAFNINGPDKDIGDRGPTRYPIYNMGTIRFAPQGEGRKLRSELAVSIDSKATPWFYDPPVTDFLVFTVKDEAGKDLIPPQYKAAPANIGEIEPGTNVFLMHTYGFDGFDFPETLGGSEPVKLLLTWKINPAYGSGQMDLFIVLDDQDHGIIDETTVLWLPANA